MVTTTHNQRDIVHERSAGGVVPSQGGTERAHKKRSRSSKHTRGAATAEDSLENMSQPLHHPPPPPPLSSKSRHKGEGSVQWRLPKSHDETSSKPRLSGTSVAPSLSTTSSAGSLVRMERATAYEQRQRLKVTAWAYLKGSIP